MFVVFVLFVARVLLSLLFFSFCGAPFGVALLYQRYPLHGTLVLCTLVSDCGAQERERRAADKREQSGSEEADLALVRPDPEREKFAKAFKRLRRDASKERDEQ